MHLPLTQYHGGGAAATYEPLAEHRADYALRLASLLGGGVTGVVRGTRLYDSPETMAVVQREVAFYKAHRAILDSALLPLRRADGRDWDGWIHVNPALPEAGLVVGYTATAACYLKRALTIYFVSPARAVGTLLCPAIATALLPVTRHSLWVPLLGVPLPPEDEKLPPEIELQLSAMMAQAAQQVLQQSQSQAAQQQAQQQAQDPVLQLQQQELAIRQQEAQTKAMKAQADIELAKQKLQQDAAENVAKLQAERQRTAATVLADQYKAAKQRDLDALKTVAQMRSQREQRPPKEKPTK
jgi:hypothetical protein